MAAAGDGTPPADDGNGSPLGDGIWETDGNWTVTDGEDLNFENLTIIMNGNLTVEFGGKVTLKGIELVMNCSEDLQYYIRLRTNAALTLEDMDGDASTTDDGSNVRSWYASARYTLLVDNGATFNLLRSRMADMGSDVATGMELDSDDVLIEDSVLESWSSIFVDGSAPVFRRSRLTGNLASSLYFNYSAPLIEECVIINCYYGINARGGPGPTVFDTDVANCFLPLNLELTSATMRGGLLEASPFGTDLRLNQSSRAVLVDVEFDEANIDIVDEPSSLEVWWTLSLRVTDQGYNALEGAEVVVNDTHGELVVEDLTGPDGNLSMELMEFMANNESREDLNPYTFRVSKGKYHAVVSFNVTTTMSREVTVMTNLRPVVQIVSPQPGIRVVMGQTIVFDATPTFDPNGDTLTFNWTTNVADRPLYSGPDPVMTASLLLGETAVMLTVSDGEGGTNSTTISVQVLGASIVTKTLTKPQFIATLEATFGGDGQVLLEEGNVPPPHGPQLIGVFIWVHVSGDAILANGELEVNYQPSLLPYGMQEDTLTIALEDGGVWIDVEGSQVDTVGHMVTATIDRVGVYAIKGVMPPNIPPRLRVLLDDVLVPPHDIEVAAGEFLDITFIVQDELPNFASVDVSPLPDFLRLDSSTKRLWGDMPDSPASFQLTVVATDVGDLRDEATIFLNITGRLADPELWSAIVDPPEGSTRTDFDIRVVYRSTEELPPEYVRVRIDNETLDLLPVNPDDTNYMAGVMYHTLVRLNSGSYKLYFETSDGVRTNATTEPVTLKVSGSTFEPDETEVGILVVTIIAIVVILAIIHMTSQRYNEMRKAHMGRDSETELDYITPDKEVPDEDADEDAEEGDEEEPEDGEEEEPTTGEKVHVVMVDEEEIAHIDDDVDRLEEELSELDGEIDHEEEELAKIDEEIEEIIDELDEDRERID
jgi:hypothetical protein